jgi:hypothetical protein
MLHGSGGLKDQDNLAASSKEEESTLATGADSPAAVWSLEPGGEQAASKSTLDGTSCSPCADYYAF